MKKIFKKFWFLVLLGILTLGLLVTTIVVLASGDDMKSYSGELFEIAYDTTWKIKSKKDGILELVHRKSKSSLVIEETMLQDEYQYAVMDDLIDELSYSISSQNKNYKLLSKEKTQVGKDNSEGYKLLYEDDKNQILVVITKNGAKLRLFTYSAKYEYFDMVLDSASNIMDSYESTEGKSGSSAVSVKLTELTWTTNDKIKNLASKLKDEEIANYNYKVKFKLPEALEKSSLSSTSLGFYYDNIKISLFVGTYSKNIYEYVNDKDGSIYDTKESLQKKKETYSNIKDGIEYQEVDGKKRYVYKLTYDMTLSGKKESQEQVVIVYELDKSHVAMFKIESDYSLPKEFVDSIKMVSFENYANNVKREIVDGKLIGEMKAFKEVKGDTATVVKLKLPVEYQEIDSKTDLYSTRYYGKNYNDDYFYYEYDVHYDYIFSSEKGAVDSVKSSYNSYKTRNGYKNLVESGILVLNNREYVVLDGGYYESVFSVIGSKQVFSNVKYLICKAGNKYLTIELKGNGSPISNDVLNEITNFDIEEKKEKR